MRFRSESRTWLARWACRLSAVLALAALAGAVVGCDGQDRRPRNLLLISIDTLRPDLLGCYGYERPSSPRIDGLAADGVVFETALSTSPWTLPAHGSLLTGLYPTGHGLRSRRHALPTGVVPLAEVLAGQGFATSAVVNSFWLDDRFGFDRGFGDFELIRPGTGAPEPSGVFDRAIEWLRGLDERPFFLLVHDYHVHSDYVSLPEHERLFVRPYDGPFDGSTSQMMDFRHGRIGLEPRDRDHLVDRYVAGIHQTDARIGKLLDFLATSGRLDPTLVVITSDHGEEFLEHGGILHGRTHYEELLRVPLVLRGPGVPARRVSEPVSLVDVVPTVLSLLGIPAPAGLDGIDLSPALGGQGRIPADRHLFAEADHHNEKPDILRTVRQGSLKLTYNRLTRERRLFDLARDPGERRDLSGERPEDVSRLMDRLQEHQRRASREGQDLPELDPEERERLRALGYLD